MNGCSTTPRDLEAPARPCRCRARGCSAAPAISGSRSVPEAAGCRRACGRRCEAWSAFMRVETPAGSRLWFRCGSRSSARPSDAITASRVRAEKLRAAVRVAPSSAATLVMTTCWMPQGTIRSKPSRSLTTLSAKPWKRHPPLHVHADARDLAARRSIRPCSPGLRSAGMPSASSASISASSSERRYQCRSSPKPRAGPRWDIPPAVPARARSRRRPAPPHGLRCRGAPISPRASGRLDACVVRPRVITGSCSTRSSTSSRPCPGAAALAAEPALQFQRLARSRAAQIDHAEGKHHSRRRARTRGPQREDRHGAVPRRHARAGPFAPK